MRKSTESAYRVTRLDQVKVLADPLRLRILKAFVGKPRTTKQVADLLGVNAPRLYRHVEALRRAGLLKLVDERRKRGTVERYLEAVASRFELEPSLLGIGEPAEGSTDVDGVIRALFRGTESELLEAGRRSKSSPDARPVAARFSGFATREDLMDLRGTLLEWLRRCQSYRDAEPGGRVEFGGMVAFYVNEGSATSDGELDGEPEA